MVTKNPYSDYMKMFSEYKTPAMDMNRIFSISRRNAEAFSAATTMMTESVQAISRQQAESVRSNVECILKAAKDMMGSGSPEINTTKQAELAKNMFEASFANLRTASEMMTKSMFEASDVINRRAAESLEEMGSLTKAA